VSIFSSLQRAQSTSSLIQVLYFHVYSADEVVNPKQDATGKAQAEGAFLRLSSLPPFLPKALTLNRRFFMLLAIYLAAAAEAARMEIEGEPELREGDEEVEGRPRGSFLSLLDATSGHLTYLSRKDLS